MTPDKGGVVMDGPRRGRGTNKGGSDADPDGPAARPLRVQGARNAGLLSLVFAAAAVALPLVVPFERGTGLLAVPFILLAASLAAFLVRKARRHDLDGPVLTWSVLAYVAGFLAYAFFLSMLGLLTA